MPRHADDEVRATQEELRRRNVYFGDIDGRPTPELQEALKRYQRRKSLSTSGQSDNATLRSLGVVARAPGEAPPKELEWPDEPVLKSDVRIDVPQIAERVAEESGVTAESIAPDMVRMFAAGGSARRAKSSARVVKSGSSAAGAQPPGRTGRVTRTQREDQQVEPAELRAFIAGYLAAASRGDLENELRFYADRVNYFHNGSVDRRIVERTLRDYYARWTRHAYKLEGVVSYRPVPSRGEIVVVCRIGFTLKQGGKTLRGATDSEFVINSATADPRIVSVQERRVRS